MDSTSSPQVDSTNVPKANPTAQQPAVAPISPMTPLVQPVVQEAQATITAPNQGSSGPSKALIGILIFVALVIMAVLSYFLYTRPNPQSTDSTTTVVTPAPTVIMASPTPKNEVEEVDRIDVSFPATDAASIQNELQGL